MLYNSALFDMSEKSQNCIKDCRLALHVHVIPFATSKNLSSTYFSTVVGVINNIAVVGVINTIANSLEYRCCKDTGLKLHK